MTVTNQETEFPTNEGDEDSLVYPSLADAIMALHGVPREAAEASLRHMGSGVNIDYNSDGTVSVEVQEDKHNIGQRLINFLSSLWFR